MAPEDKIARRRARAHALSAEGMSLRAIGRKLGYSKETIRRDLAEPAPELTVISNIQNSDGSPVAGQRSDEPGRALTHGCHSQVVLAPRAEEVAGSLRTSLASAYGDQAEPMVQVAALAIARLERAQSWLDEHGEVDEDGQLRPLVRVVGNWQAEARRSLEALGLTPDKWAQLNLHRVKGAALTRHLRDKYGMGEP